MNFLRLTPAEAVLIRGGDAIARLDPRLVWAGPEAGNYVLPLSVLDDPDHADRAAALALLPIVDLDLAAAWPSVDL